MSDELSHDERLCQSIAVALWSAATGENQAISRYDAPTYRHLELALIAALRETYGLSALMAKRVRNLFADLGPYDGIKSHVAYVKSHRGENF